MYLFRSGCEKDTRGLGGAVAAILKGTETLALYGGMGMGKTAFTRGLADYFGLGDYVSSPTFSIINEYCGDKKIYHFDMYRITDPDDLESTGFYDFAETGIMIIEWSENILSEIPDNAFNIIFEKGEGDNLRNIFIEGKDLD